MLDKATSDKLYKDVQSYRLITVATLVDRLKINGSLARAALRDLEEKGQIKKVVGHSKLSIYSESSWPLISRCAREQVEGEDGFEDGWLFSFLLYCGDRLLICVRLIARAVTAGD